MSVPYILSCFDFLLSSLLGKRWFDIGHRCVVDVASMQVGILKEKNVLGNRRQKDLELPISVCGWKSTISHTRVPHLTVHYGGS